MRRCSSKRGFKAKKSGMFAIDAETGNEEWLFPTEPAPDRKEPVPYRLGNLIVTDDTVFGHVKYANAPPELVAIERTGQNVNPDDERVIREGISTRGFTLANGWLHFREGERKDGNTTGGGNVQVIAIDPRTGAEQWASPKIERAPGRSSETAAGDSLFFRFGDDIYVLDARTGEVRWQWSGSNIGSDPIVVDRTIYYADYRSLHAIEADVDGSSDDWQVRHGASNHYDGWAEKASAAEPTPTRTAASTSAASSATPDEEEPIRQPGFGAVSAAGGLLTAAYLRYQRNKNR